MRAMIKTEEIKPGIKAFAWESFCLKRDTIRRKYNPNYDPMKLSEATQMIDWAEFEDYYREVYEKAFGNREAS